MLCLVLLPAHARSSTVLIHLMRFLFVFCFFFLPVNTSPEKPLCEKSHNVPGTTACGPGITSMLPSHGSRPRGHSSSLSIHPAPVCLGLHAETITGNGAQAWCSPCPFPSPLFTKLHEIAGFFLFFFLLFQTQQYLKSSHKIYPLY